MRKILLLLAVVAVLGGGCGYDDEPASPPPDLTGAFWRVAAGLKTADWETAAPTMRFTDEGVWGSSGCNDFDATYERNGDKLTIKPGGTTLVRCQGTKWDVEIEFAKLLDAVASWRIEGGELVLADAGGKELLRLQEPLVVGSWEVAFVRLPDTMISPIEGTEMTAVFSEDGTLTGNAGCNTYETTYTYSRGNLTIARPTMTSSKTCTEPAGIMEQEQAFLTQIPLTTTYSFSSRTLYLSNPQGNTGTLYPAD